MGSGLSWRKSLEPHLIASPQVPVSQTKFIPFVGLLVQKPFANVPSGRSLAPTGREDQNLTVLTASLVLATANSTTTAGSLLCPNACRRPLGEIWTTSHQLSLVCSVSGMSPQWTSHAVTHGAPAILDLAYSCRLGRPATFSTHGRGLDPVSCTEWTSSSVTSHASSRPQKELSWLYIRLFLNCKIINHTYKTVHEMCNLKNFLNEYRCIQGLGKTLPAP